MPNAPDFCNQLLITAEIRHLYSITNTPHTSMGINIVKFNQSNTSSINWIHSNLNTVIIKLKYPHNKYKLEILHLINGS